MHGFSFEELNYLLSRIDDKAPHGLSSKILTEIEWNKYSTPLKEDLNPMINPIFGNQYGEYQKQQRTTSG